VMFLMTGNLKLVLYLFRIIKKNGINRNGLGEIFDNQKNVKGGIRKGANHIISDLHPLSRRERDSNPRRLSPQRFSRPPQSTTLPSLQGRMRGNILVVDLTQSTTLPSLQGATKASAKVKLFS
jgi:hypothetical protein